VDDNSAIRQLLRSFLEANTDWIVCGEAENGLVAVEKVNELQPNVVILDFSMPVMNGLDAAREISREAPNVVIFLFTMHNSERLKEDAKRVGVQQVVSKSDPLEHSLLPSLRMVSAAF
jgi:DNA-binding NarL/FixJ family response regulator